MCRIPTKILKQHTIPNLSLHNLKICSSKGCIKPVKDLFIKRVHKTGFFLPIHPSPPPKVNPLPTKQQFSSYNSKKPSILSCSHCPRSIFVLMSYSLDTQVMSILILIDVQYSQNAVFSLEKCLTFQNHSSSGSIHLLKKSPSKISDPPPHLVGEFSPVPYCSLENPGKTSKR